MKEFTYRKLSEQIKEYFLKKIDKKKRMLKKISYIFLADKLVENKEFEKLK